MKRSEKAKRKLAARIKDFNSSGVSQSKTLMHRPGSLKWRG